MPGLYRTNTLVYLPDAPLHIHVLASSSVPLKRCRRPPSLPLGAVCPPHSPHPTSTGSPQSCRPKYSEPTHHREQFRREEGWGGEGGLTLEGWGELLQLHRGAASTHIMQQRRWHGAVVRKRGREPHRTFLPDEEDQPSRVFRGFCAGPGKSRQAGR